MTAAARPLVAVGPGKVRVTRSRRATRWTLVPAIAVLLVLAYLPYGSNPGTTAVFTNFLILLTMAMMWNLLAGYGGLVSVGQQAYVGLGAYAVLALADNGISPFVAVPLAAIFCGLVAIPISWLVFRTRGGYFAIATWVVAVVFELIISRITVLEGGTGVGLPGLFTIDPAWLTAYTYWAALAVAVASVAAVYLVLRSRIGLALTAIRDNEVGARSLGVQVGLMKRVVFAISAAGTGAAGGLVAISQLNVQAASVFSVQWSAYMIFVVVIGGLGSIEGPILGSIIFFGLQQTLSGYGAWYLILVGAIAIAVALWSPRGLWGFISERLRFSFFNTGYWLWPATRAPSTSDPPSSAAESARKGATATARPSKAGPAKAG